MSKTEAALIIANETCVFSRKNGGLPIDKALVEERMSEAPHLGGIYPEAAAAAPSWKTVLRIARRNADLLAF